jgi:hypothetical protein
MGASSLPQGSPPSRVAELAQRLRFGPLETGRKGGSRLATLVLGMLVAGGLMGVAVLINWLLQYVRVEALALVALFAVLAAVAATVLTFYLVVRGYTTLYVYAGGIVWTGRGRPKGVGWTDIDSLYAARRSGKDTSADLVLFDGSIISVEGHGKAGPDPVFEHLRKRVAGLNRPVVNSTFAAARILAEKETGLGDRTIVRVSVILGVLASFGFGFLLWKAGLPGPVAAIVAPMIVAVLAISVGLAVDTRLVRTGYGFFVVTGVVVLSVAIKVLDEVNWAVVSVTVLAAEGALLAAWHALYVRLPARRPTRRRKRLAAETSWQYLPQAPVPVGGPRTARWLLGVRNNVTATTGADAVHGTANGLPVMVFDRWRRPPRIPDPVQTGWVVSLPMTLPFFAPSYFYYVAASQRDPNAPPTIGDVFDNLFGARGRSDPTPLLAGTGPVVPGDLAEHTSDPDVARLIAASPVRSAMNALRLPASWWVEGRCLYATASGVTTNTERGYAENLTALAAAFPWQALHARLG